MSHGQLQFFEDTNILAGRVVTRALNEGFHFKKNEDKRGDKGPDFLVMAKSPVGHEYHAGFAYQYQINQGEMSGNIGFNIVLNDPDFGQVYWFSAFPKAQNLWDLSLKRDQKPQPVQEQAAA